MRISGGQKQLAASDSLYNHTVRSSLLQDEEKSSKKKHKNKKKEREEAADAGEGEEKEKEKKKKKSRSKKAGEMDDLEAFLAGGAGSAKREEGDYEEL